MSTASENIIAAKIAEMEGDLSKAEAGLDEAKLYANEKESVEMDMKLSAQRAALENLKSAFPNIDFITKP